MSSRFSAVEGVVFRAAAGGAIGFSVGLFGPILLTPEANLGPLVGILVATPIGAIAGAAWGLARSAPARDAAGSTRVAALVWAAWVAALLFTLFLARLAAWFAWAGVAAQSIILIGAVAAFYAPGVRRDRTSSPGSAMRLPLVASIALAALLTLFPPIARPSWGPSPSPPSAAGGPQPYLAYLGDPRFASSRHVPLFVMNLGRLELEWLLATGAIFALARLVASRRRANRSSEDGGGASRPES